MIPFILLIISLPLGSHAKTNEYNLLTVTELKTLNLEKPLSENRGAYVSAASGLVEKNGTFYFVADDEEAIFSIKNDSKLSNAFPLSHRKLSTNPELRRIEKPDYEALMILSNNEWPPHGALVAWPSASNNNRRTAALIILAEDGSIKESKTIDISKFANKLSKQAKSLNLEGAFSYNSKAFFIQRGNSENADSGYFKFALSDIFEGLKNNKWPKKTKLIKLNIGKLKNVKLTLTDATHSAYGIIGVAAAEATDSALSDGEIMGSVLVHIQEKNAKVLGQLSLVKKFEGIVARESAEGLDIFLVDDADDPNKKSSLYKTSLAKSLLMAAPAKN